MISAIVRIATWLLGKIFGSKEAAGVAQGRAEQKNVDAQAVSKQEEKARDVEIHLDAAGPGELDRLRSKWTRPD